MLFPQFNEKREVMDLSGIWRFKVDKNNCGYEEKWYQQPLVDTIMMPVPASYNDLTQDPEIRDHIGDVWYEREFYIAKSWENKRVVLRLSGVAHYGTVWVNGKEVLTHKGGFLPFEANISAYLKSGLSNRITIAVDNRLNWSLLPPGEVKTFSDDSHPTGHQRQEYHFDFYNYSGIHRPVKLYTTDKCYIEDIFINTEIDGKDGVISYKIKGVSTLDCAYELVLKDRDGQRVADSKGQKGSLLVKDANLWGPGNPYLYTLEVRLSDGAEIRDVYRLPVGIRTIEVRGQNFLINGKRFYFKGFGKHEDSDLRGKGLDQVINVKDFNLLKWIGANSFRTSHYPYAEEIINLADQEGIIVIDEVPAVGFNLWDESRKVYCEERVNQETLEYHLQVVKDLIARDKNHPSVVMWSLANEPVTYEDEALSYFSKLVEETRKLDPTRPITIVENTEAERSKVAHLFDVICVNRYYSWYTDPGELDVIELQAEKELLSWYERFKKPVIMSEYGADTIAGFHSDPPVMFSEEYQCKLLDRYHKVFDRLDFMVGEHVWNFADFATKQGITRVMGNKKGVFTRQRQPKMAAHLLRKRWKNK